MKKIFTLIFSAIIIQSAMAQTGKSSGYTFKKFKVDVSLGYAKPQSDDTDGGVIFVIEPKYAVLNQLSVGLRMEGAGLARVGSDGESGKVRILGSYVATGDYYFTNNRFRPFAGAGGGIFTMASVDIEDSDETIPMSSSFGFMVRTGFEYGHLRLGLEYNILKDKAGYFGVKLGACIGGGRK
ncbi:MAG: outer membrane beta-barrel protein [Bacteroidota bacterium]